MAGIRKFYANVYTIWLTMSIKADLFLSGIVQLIGVILADKLNKHHLFKSIRKLLA